MSDAVGAYHETVERVDSTNRRIVQIALVGALVVVLIVFCGMAFISYKINDGNSVIHAVRTAQIQNTRAANARSDCQNRALDTLLNDINLSITHPGQHLTFNEIPKC